MIGSSCIAFSNPTSTVHDKSRRNTISIIGSFSSAFILPDQVLFDRSLSGANAAPLLPFGNTDRRQLELCLVSILRVRYWAETVANSIVKAISDAPPTGMTDSMKGSYLEARLGAKAIITGRIGGGANSRVYALSSIKLRDCVKDGLSYFNESYGRSIKDSSLTSEEKANLKKQKILIQDASEEIIESLAAVVEFDGLDNTQDPSPRSSLALSMYSDTKAVFVKRLLLERTVKSCDIFINAFGAEKRLYCERYIKSTYPNELPPSFVIK